jgi:Flp pilus assembly protein TadD
MQMTIGFRPGIASGARLRLLLLAFAVFAAQPATADESTCGSLRNATGPFDYRKANRDTLQLVEDFHFTREVESLREGKSGYLGGDLDYTLRAFPNHARALAALMALQFKARTDRPQGTKWPVSCYFDRAIRFAPDDGTVRTVLGIYLMRLGKTKEAIEQFKLAASLGEDSGNLHYNLGLAYFELGDFAQSVVHAKKAYALGFQLHGLKNKLVKAGKWPPDQ